MQLSDEADDLWEKIQKNYVNAGYPPHGAWFVPLGDSGPVRELEAAGYIESKAVGRTHFVLTWSGMSELLDRNEISDEAFELRQKIARDYEAQGFPAYQSWIIRPDPSEEHAANELAARGYL
ncbi:MAG TPA: hypothetical protein VMW56_21820, partial [Candidatus Margulisiibacteriota bacterium]|nr:hypothetical protein [Candidatus Margulisiibacteriota bacterium]